MFIAKTAENCDMSAMDEDWVSIDTWNGHRDAGDTLRRAMLLALGEMHIMAGKSMLKQKSYDTTANSICKVVQPLIAAYIRNRGHQQKFSDGYFTLTNSAGLTISPLVWPVGLLPGTEAILSIGSDLDNSAIGAHNPSQSIQNHVDQACSRTAERVDEALSRLEEVDSHLSALQQTVNESIEAQHRDRTARETQTERLIEARRDALEHERELERDRRDRERESERDRRQRERDNMQDLTQRGRPLITSAQDPAPFRSAETTMSTDLRELTNQVREIATTLQRACGERIVLGQGIDACRRRRLRCLRYFACRTPP